MKDFLGKFSNSENGALMELEYNNSNLTKQLWFSELLGLFYGINLKIRPTVFVDWPWEPILKVVSNTHVQYELCGWRCANVFGSASLKHIPSFSWGGSEGFETFRLGKSI